MVPMYGILFLMGNRDYKQFGAGEYYHIYNRGNEKEKIFLDEGDFNYFILKLNQNLFPSDFRKTKFRTPPLPENSFSLVCYCLMPNHFHLLIKQNKEIRTSQLILRVCTSFSKYFNKKYDRVGHLFQDQFKQEPVGDNSYLSWLSAYIHQNPKTSGLVEKTENYKWGSYQDYIDLSRGLIKCDKKIILDQFKTVSVYRDFVESSYEVIKKRKDLECLLLDNGDF